MIQLILLIVGVFYFVKRPRLKRLAATNFPAVPPDRFEEWRHLELASIDIFLWATWGLAIIGTIFGFVLAAVIPESAGVFTAGYIVLFLAGLTVSAIKGSKAAGLKKSLGINWPRKRRPPRAPGPKPPTGCV